ncbi:hypothetical protein SAMN05444156_0641 [Verrucomicrobium sp. GAS474]|uniref:hypothetical protein n=1 Tax=Verrucomicrobium sp. GAS474 TaxID=1882831 RepID=UPI000879438C|nr:hypothetical protein [Verrucomicrobium sp. GAS474]SDT90867.1 hypothetical protein SAMN05444156_0641 [Verrucomicrobium sp. GAS474]
MKKTTFGMLLGLMAFAAMALTAPTAKAEDYTPAQMQQIEEMKKTYPLTTCPISGDKLEGGEMGKPIDYLYTAKDASGKETTRLVRFCCPSCVRKFKKDPAPTLKVLDDAAAKKASGAASAPAPTAMGGAKGM